MPLCITSKQNKILLFIIFNYYTYLKVYLLFYPFLYRLLKLTLQKPKKKKRKDIPKTRKKRIKYAYFESKIKISTRHNNKKKLNSF